MTSLANGPAPRTLDPLTPLSSALPEAKPVAVMPSGFVAGGLAAGIKRSGRPDLALIATAGGVPASVAAVFTTNAFAAAPVRRSRVHLLATAPDGGGRHGHAAAIVCTSGSANAATGAAGDADQLTVAEDVADALDIAVEHVLTLSTGVIGTRLPLPVVRSGVARLAPSLTSENEGLVAAARAFMTTDTRVKLATVRLRLAGSDGTEVPVMVSGLAKGVGMIHPRMATMLAVILTDAAAAPATLAGLLRPAAARTWDQLTVDGDTSTNDTVFLLASGGSGAAEVVPGSATAGQLGAAVEAVARSLARQQAADGEGATTLITCQVSGAADDADARAVARAVAASSLVKAAVHGRDPNWGRIAAAGGNAHLADASVLEAAGLPAVEAAGRAGQSARLDPDRLRVAIAGTLVFAGLPLEFDRDAVRRAMDAPEVRIRLDLGLGQGSGEAFGCDLSEEYVVENADYTT
ncbi:MAG: bifunctional ornithine acetyltransferase/N-acetylglutamate synthase [Candidatus Limnocylindrales bacterium]